MPNTATALLQITVNGASHDVASRTVAALVEELALDPRAVAIEQNRSIVPRSAYGITALNAGDQIEIVRFIGGG